VGFVRQIEPKLRSIGLVAFPLLATVMLATLTRSGGNLGESAPPTDDTLASARAHARFDDLIRKYAARYGVEAALIKAVMHAESDFRVRVRSLRGACGLMQVMPRTGRAYGVRHLDDPNENVRAGVRYLRFLLDVHDHDPELAVAAYNAGSSTVKQYGGIPPFPETRRYVAKVMRYRRRYQSEMASLGASTAAPRSES